MPFPFLKTSLAFDIFKAIGAMIGLTCDKSCGRRLLLIILYTVLRTITCATLEWSVLAAQIGTNCMIFSVPIVCYRVAVARAMNPTCPLIISFCYTIGIFGALPCPAGIVNN